jgi:SAM-dependent methyltransferase
MTFLGTSPLGTVLIPGCGIGHEARAFYKAGWNVTAIDFSPVAIEQARTRLGAVARHIILGDFFSHDFVTQGFDVIYERTFLCALPPSIWPAYAERMAHLLRPGGRLVGFFLYGEEPEPPPYPLTEMQARELFGETFSLLRSDPVEDSPFLFAGKERWQEWERGS